MVRLAAAAAALSTDAEVDPEAKEVIKVILAS